MHSRQQNAATAWASEAATTHAALLAFRKVFGGASHALAVALHRAGCLTDLTYACTLLTLPLACLCGCRSALRESRPPSIMDLWEDDVPWGNMSITALKVCLCVWWWGGSAGDRLAHRMLLHDCTWHQSGSSEVPVQTGTVLVSVVKIVEVHA